MVQRWRYSLASVGASATRSGTVLSRYSSVSPWRVGTSSSTRMRRSLTPRGHRLGP